MCEEDTFLKCDYFNQGGVESFGTSTPSTNEKICLAAVIETISPVKMKSSSPVGLTLPSMVVPSGEIISLDGLPFGPSIIWPVTIT